jgi:hypothetical protein
MYAVLLRLDLDCRKTIVRMERERPRLPAGKFGGADTSIIGKRAS